MKRLIRTTTRVKGPVVGLDVHKAVIVYCVLDAEGDVAHSGDVAAQSGPLLERLARLLGAPGGHVTLEACGHSMWVYDLLRERYGEERVHLAQSARIRMIANSSEKNDRNDAWWLAFLTQEGRLPTAYMPPGIYRDVRLAARERIEAVKLRVRAAVRLKAELAQMGERPPYVDLDSEATQEFVRDLGKRTDGVRGAKLLRSLDLFLRMTQERDYWASQLEALAEQLPDWRRLQKEIPGIGKTLSATILGETGPIGRFKSPKALARFTGLTPSDRSTGGKTIHGAITREGSPALRWALIEAVTHCARSTRGPQAAVRRWVTSRAKRLGKAKARAGAARKLAVSIWHCVTKNVPFDAVKAFGPEPTPRPAPTS